jgi:sulfate transport system ATP-binding protein
VAGEGIAVRLNHAYLAGPSAYLELQREDGALLEAQLAEAEYRELDLREGAILLARPRRGRIFPAAA